jgi:hypothetical protein
MHYLSAPQTIPERCLAKHVLVIAGQCCPAGLKDFIQELRAEAVVHTTELSLGVHAGGREGGWPALAADDVVLETVHHTIPHTEDFLCVPQDMAAEQVLGDYADIEEIHTFCSPPSDGEVLYHLAEKLKPRGVKLVQH